jgi:hypothetical protein
MTTEIMPVGDEGPSAPVEPVSVAFTPQMDERILRGMVEDEVACLREMVEHGHPAPTVRARAAHLGLTEQIVLRCRLAGTSPSMRDCLACERRFLSTGPQHRLCKRCRPLR